MKPFENLPSQNTPVVAVSLNQIQDNLVVVSPTEPTGDNREKVWMQKKGKNLFNKNDYLSNLNIVADGSFDTDSNSRLYYIKVKEGETYTISSNVDRQWVFSTSATIPILNGSGKPRTVTTGYSTQITIPDGDKYLIIRHYPNNDEDNINQNIQVELGIVATIYEEPAEPKIYVLNDNDVYEEFISKEDTLERYSTEEQIIGTWIDEKTLYRKVINVGTTATVTTKIDYIPDIKAIIKQYVSYSWGGMLFSIGSNAIYSGSGNIAMEFDRAPESTNIVAVIEYTKTTDKRSRKEG